MASEQVGKAEVKVISGGQTGADLAGLRAARDLGLETGGFAAAGFWNEDGAQPGLGPEFGLVETKGSYVHRTKLNVDAADCTVAFLAAERGSGTSKTVGYALTGKWTDGFASSAQGCYCYRPVLKRRLTLNVAGHRTSLAKSLGLAFDYDRRCYDILQLALKVKVKQDAEPARKGKKRTREPEPLVHELVHT